MSRRDSMLREMDRHERMIRGLQDAIMQAMEIGERELVEDLQELLDEARDAYREYAKTGSCERVEQLRWRLEREIEADEQLNRLLGDA